MLKTLESPWTARRSNLSILKEISPEYSLEGLMLKLLYFDHLIWRIDSLEKTLMLGKIEGGRRKIPRDWSGWMASPTRWAWVWASSGSWWWTVKPGVLQSMGLQKVRHDWATELNRLNPNLPISPLPLLPIHLISISVSLLWCFSMWIYQLLSLHYGQINYHPASVWEISSSEKRTRLCHLFSTTRLGFQQVSVICFLIGPITLIPLLKYSVPLLKSVVKSFTKQKMPGTLLPDILLRVKNKEANRDVEGG